MSVQAGAYSSRRRMGAHGVLLAACREWTGQGRGARRRRRRTLAVLSHLAWRGRWEIDRIVDVLAACGHRASDEHGLFDRDASTGHVKEETS